MTQGLADDVKIKPRRLFKEIDQARPRPKIESVKAKSTLACDSIHVVFKTRKSKAALCPEIYIVDLGALPTFSTSDATEIEQISRNQQRSAKN